MRLKINIKISMVLALLLFGFLGTKVYAQVSDAAIKGVVSDEFGRPLVGVVVRTENGKNFATTDFDGSFSLTPNDGSANLIFSHLGFADQTVALSGATTVNAEMKVDAHNLDEVINMGRTSQKRRAISGAVSVVTGEELEKAPVANLALALTGRLPGLFTWETGSEPSRTGSALVVRGLSSGNGGVGSAAPLVVLDGIPIQYNPNQVYEYISAREIESIVVLKDASTTALYGIQSQNGVLVINTKRGQVGDIKINAQIDQSLQQVTTRPHIYDSWEYAMLRNEAARNDQQGDYAQYSYDMVNHFYAQDSELFPNNDWYNMFFRDFATMTRVGVNVSGGTDVVRYFSNINFMHQSGQFKTDNDEYKSGPNNNWFNYRSNIDLKLNRYLSGYIRLGGNIKRERQPRWSTGAQLYESMFNMNPTIFGPLTPDGEVVAVEGNDNPTYGLLNRQGYTRHTVTNISSIAGLDLDMSFVTPGLSMGGTFSYQTNSVGSLHTYQDYRRYMRTDDWEILEFNRKGTTENDPLNYSKSHSHYYNINGSANIAYERDFGKHSVTGMGYFFYQSLTTAAAGNTNEMFPRNRAHFGAQATYGYDDRYFVKLDLGYSASEQFARNARWTATPSISAAWLASSEEFLKDSEWLSLLKVRASYGKTAYDRVNGLPRFAYLDNASFVGGGHVGSLQFLTREGLVGNPDITSEVNVKQNYGIDLGLYNVVTLSVDYFRENLDNMIIRGTGLIPYYQGIPLGDYPATNSGKFKNEGFELAATFTKDISKDWTVFGGGNFTYNKNEVIYNAETLNSANYAYRNRYEGFSVGQQFGYLTEGYWTSYEEIENSGLTYSFINPRPGDLKYRDMNNDGIINDADLVPLGYGNMPQVFYSFNAGLRFKSFELSFMFQGVGRWESLYGGDGVFETATTGLFGSLHSAAWTKERYDAGEKITAPALSLTESSNHRANDYYLYDRSYIRLKNLELAYTLPEKVARAISADRIRLTLSGQNLITWDNMKSSDFGPEASSYKQIPVYRVYNIGVNLIF